MTKPTLLQSILGRPSQSYSFPQEKVYFSSRRDLLRIAVEAKATNSASNAGYMSGGDQGYPPGTSDRSASHVQQPSLLPVEAQTPHDVHNTSISSTVVVSPLSAAPNSNDTDDDNDNEADDEPDSDQDVFYTPNTSPRTSMASSVVVPFPSPALKPALNLRDQVDPIPLARIPTRRPLSSTSTTSLSSTVATTSLDGHSLFSAPPSDSTRITTPVTSDNGHESNSPQHPIAYTKLLPTNSRTTKTRSRRTAHTSTYTDEDWAKDVRWLVAPSSDSKFTHSPPQNTKLKRRPPSEPQSSLVSYSSSSSYSRSSSQPPPSRHKRNKSISNVTPSIMMSMTALLEEDEDKDAGGINLGPTPQSNVLISGPSRMRASLPAGIPSKPHRPDNPHDHPNPVSGSGSTRSFQNLPPKAPNLRHRRSRSLDGTSRPSSDFLPILPKSTSLPSASTLYPYNPDLPSHGTPGYTSLTLPRAPLLPSASLPGNNLGKAGLGLGGDGKVDLTRSGIAQTTMASVEVVRGLGAAGRSGFRMPLPFLGRRRTLSGVVTASGSGERPLGFTSHRAPPSYVPAGSVLVQVWAVGVDGVDGRLVGGKVGGSEGVGTGSGFGFGLGRSGSLRFGKGRTYGEGGGNRPSAGTIWSTGETKGEQLHGKRGQGQAEVGFIPGRSFVGRVLECGWEVREEVVRRGEWVAGLLDIRKCGALAEFIVVDRHRVYRVPYPRMHSSLEDTSYNLSQTDGSPDPTSISRSMSMSSSSSHSPRPRFRSRPSKPVVPPLSLEELALLPLCGVPAYRAVRTFAFASSSLREDGHGPGHSRDAQDGSGGKQQGDHETGRRRRVLVLRGHDGVGAMAVQMLVRRGWRVCVHAPLLGFVERERVEKRRYVKAVEERVNGWGAEKVVFDDGAGGDGDDWGRGAVVRAIERFLEDGDVFDAVLDTVGGKEVWEASERLMRSNGVDGGKGQNRSAKGKGQRGRGQFTTLVGDVPGRAIPSAGDHFKAGLRSLRLRNGGRSRSDSGGQDEGRGSGSGSGNGKVGYAWVSVAQDVDWEGEDVRESLGAVLRMALDDGIRPWTEGVYRSGDEERGKAVPFERAPEVFGDGGLLQNRDTVVVKVVG